MISSKIFRVQFLLGCFMVSQFSCAVAQVRNHDGFYEKGGKLYSIGMEYVSGFDTSLKAYSLRLGYGTMLSNNLSLYGLLDISATDGFRILDEENEKTRLNSESFGLGTSFLLRWHLIRIGCVGVYIDLGGGILYTFESFPPKGSKLNFTARPGAGLTLHLNSSTQLLVGVNRFHLSNGQGYKHPNNPAFDGLGVFVGLIFREK